MRFVWLMSFVLVFFGFGAVEASLKQRLWMYCHHVKTAKDFKRCTSRRTSAEEIKQQDATGRAAEEGAFSFANLASEDLFHREVCDLLKRDQAGELNFSVEFLSLCDSEMPVRRWQRKAAMLLDMVAFKATKTLSGSAWLGPIEVSFAAGQPGKHNLLPLASIRLGQCDGLSEERLQQFVEVICSYLWFMHSIGRFSPAGCTLFTPYAPEDGWVWYLQDQKVLKVVVGACEDAL